MSDSRSDRQEPKAYSARWLVEHEQEAPHQIVSGLVTEGLALLAGKPKSGKSHLAMQLAINVARGEPSIAGYKTDRCTVLYLDLEQSLRAIRHRLVSVLGGEEPPMGLYFSADWPRLDEGGVEQFGAWFEAEPETRLIVVDTAARLWPTKQPQRINAYYWEYDLLSGVKKFAQDRGAAVLLLHHENKSQQIHRMDRVSGTGAMTGVPDSILLLERTNLAEATLYVTGREVEEKELALVWQQRRWRFKDSTLRRVAEWCGD